MAEGTAKEENVVCRSLLPCYLRDSGRTVFYDDRSIRTPTCMCDYRQKDEPWIPNYGHTFESSNISHDLTSISPDSEEKRSNCHQHTFCNRNVRPLYCVHRHNREDERTFSQNRPVGENREENIQSWNPTGGYSSERSQMPDHDLTSDIITSNSGEERSYQPRSNLFTYEIVDCNARDQTYANEINVRDLNVQPSHRSRYSLLTGTELGGSRFGTTPSDSSNVPTTSSERCFQPRSTPIMDKESEEIEREPTSADWINRHDEEGAISWAETSEQETSGKRAHSSSASFQANAFEVNGEAPFQPTGNGVDSSMPLTQQVNATKSNWKYPVFQPRSKSCKHTRDLCPDFMQGKCPSNGQCSYVHGIVCVLCKQACLHPFDQKQRENHIENCEKGLGSRSIFAMQDSTGRTCGICLEIILKKKPIKDRCFGILEKCNHVFCLGCIRKWRRCHALNHIVTSACPECRIISSYAIPSPYFVRSEKDKKTLLNEYKKVLNCSEHPFKCSKDMCPFGGDCFELFGVPHGTIVASSQPMSSRRENAENEFAYMSISEIYRHILREF